MKNILEKMIEYTNSIEADLQQIHTDMVGDYEKK